jgi:hypothetical protein
MSIVSCTAEGISTRSSYAGYEPGGPIVLFVPDGGTVGAAATITTGEATIQRTTL